MRCTWKDCNKLAKHRLVGEDGAPWAELCDEHAQRFDDAANSLDPKKLLGAWACAGKRHSARKRFYKEIAAGCSAIMKLADTLKTPRP